ncbi:MAG: Trp biosynthesis associated, transrane protein Oprn/Chp [Frankiales bacterium]|nr:Trp biosynthesis associated, transrane protein Oprn/Chp [Frankiales bacterium]
MSPRRELRLAVLLCLVGSALVLYATTRTWAVLEPTRLGSVAVDLSGDTLSGASQALGYVGLAAVLALAATKRLGRVVVGVLVLAAGIGIVIALSRVLHAGLASRALEHVSTPACTPAPGESSCGQYVLLPPVSTTVTWVWVSLVGGVLMSASGLLVAVRGPRWAALSSSYAPPAARPAEPPVTDKGVWDALDRGEDPT